MRQISLVLIAPLTSVALLSCSTSELSPEGAKVAMSNSSPSEEGYDPAGCRSLGPLIGKGGGAFGGGWISNDALVEYAMNDLRNKAAELGANYVRYDSAQMGVSGSQNGTTTTTATVAGTAYVCTDRTAPKGAAVVAQAPAPVPAKSKAPRGAAGYTFGASVEDTQAQCSKKHEWSAPDERSFACTGTPKDVGAKAQSRLRFCDGALCEIDVVVRPEGDDSKAWIAEHKRLDQALEERYGAPKDRRKKIPQFCSDLLKCIKDGDASIESTWEFEDRTRVTLNISDKPGPEAAIHVIYELGKANDRPAL